MRILKSHPLLKLVNAYLIDTSQPSNISYLWNFGSLLAVCLVIQIVTGVTLAMHYSPNVLEAFNSVEHIMRDVNNGWLIRYLHSNTASAFFFLVYLHIGRGLYYGSYKAPRTLTWTIGAIILILMIGTGFLGYVLPYGQMSLWGATVITNLISAIPWIGQDVVEFIWGGFSVNNATLNRFFALHFVLPFILAALVLMHLIALHDTVGSSNPVGVSGNYDRIPFAPYYLFKDLITVFLFIIGLSLFIFFMPNALGDSDNYIMANPMQTPAAIVPEWYLLPFYAILRSIPNKLLGVIAMFSALLIILILSVTDMGKLKGSQFRSFIKIAFWIFVANFLILMTLGAKHVESPFIEFGQISTILYFSYFLIILVVISLVENTLFTLGTNNVPKTTPLKGQVFFNLPSDLYLSNILNNPYINIFCNNNIFQSLTFYFNIFSDWLNSFKNVNHYISISNLVENFTNLTNTLIGILILACTIAIIITRFTSPAYEGGDPHAVKLPKGWDGEYFWVPGEGPIRTKFTWADKTDGGVWVLKTVRTWPNPCPQWKPNPMYGGPGFSGTDDHFYCHNYNPSGQVVPMPHYVLNVGAPLPFTNKTAQLTNPAKDIPNRTFMNRYYAGEQAARALN